MKKGVKNFVLLGPQGCGKGTQARLLLKKFKNLHYIYTGDIFREFITKNTDAAKRVKKVVNSGDLVIEPLTITLWINEIINKVKENQGILLDGSPRRLREAEDFFVLFKFLQRDKNTIIFVIDISPAETFKRLAKRIIVKNGKITRRVDDNVAGIKLRLKRYKEWTLPAINCLKKSGMRVIEINGEQTVENVFKDICKHIR